MSSKIDITGNKYNRLTVIKEQGRNNDGKALWLCQCDCGNTSIVTGTSLRSGKTKSCGCYMREQTSRASIKHGQCIGKVTRFYKIWENMKKRCNNPNNPAYYRYGGRGIKVCDEWLIFNNFFEDMYSSYVDHVEKFGEKDTTLDRKNNDDGYSLGNCRWATCKEQSNNSRSVKMITCFGETRSITEWAKKVNIPNGCLALRLNRYHWPIDEALTLPLGSSPSHRVNEQC